MKVSKRAERWSPLILLAACLLLWQLVVMGFAIPEFIFPSPVQIAQQFGEFGGPLMEAAWKTFWVTMLGFAIAIVVGVLLGFLIGSSRLAYTAIYPLMVAFNAVPKAAVVPILVVWFGIGLGPGILTAFLISFFPITVNIATGLATLEPELEDVLRVLGAKRWDVLVKVGLPRSMPYFYGSLKIAITLAFVGTVLAEMTAGDSGIGYLMQTAGSQQRMPLAFAGLVTIGAMAMAMYELFSWVEKRTTGWAHRGTQGEYAQTGPGWRGELQLRYHRRGERTVAFDAHRGPLRVLQPLYPEGEGVCHHVLVHPPGGVVGGDELHVQVEAEAGSHALLTTPGATRFYRSEGALALQHIRLRLAEGARLEWLPMESIAYSGCQASNRVIAELAPSAEMMGWDVLALGLPAAGQPFDSGVFSQQLELPGQWLERGRIAASDTTLLHGPVGWAGHTVSATLWFAAGSALAATRRTALLEAARAVLQSHALAVTAGATAPQPGVVLLRALASRVEPVMQLLAAVRAAWRQEAWGLAAEPPRVWRT